MRFSVEAWAPDYGGPLDADVLEESPATVDVGIEARADAWTPRAAPPGTERGNECVLFIDGVQRIDARVWIDDGAGRSRLGICATYAAGVARCDGAARIIDVAVERGVFTAAPDADAITTPHVTFPARAAAGDTVDHLRRAVQQRMGELERRLADSVPPADLVVVDGPLRAPRAVLNAIGYVKSHHVGYLPPVVEDVVGELKPGERTPIFLMTSSWSLYSWYLRLPSEGGHPWAGVVRCECDASIGETAAVALADRATALLPRFASSPHKDTRAPQNLYPIAGLEREMRRRSGDATFLYRSLLSAAARAS